MGKFDGVLLASDFDNTLVDTDHAEDSGSPLPPVPARNVEALRYFMAEGGRFTVATGRALPAFVPFASGVPMNAPCILSNGAALYDLERKTYVETAFLSGSIRQRGNEILDAVPGLACELYHDGMEVHCMRPNEVTFRHKHLTHAPCEEVENLNDAPGPCSKLLLEGEPELLKTAWSYILSRGWGEEYEIVTSSRYLLEVTAKGANKGDMLLRLAHRMGIAPQNAYGIGDHLNDLPLLRASAIPFAPANCVEEVRHSGARLVCSAAEGAIADVVEILETIYKEKERT